jgi:hypothetical protein
MTKPFDAAELGERIKAAGLPILEKDAKVIAEVVFGWAGDSLALAAKEQPLYAIAIPVIGTVKEIAFKAIDKIDGVEGN